jgi:hypothetical protein
VENSSRCLRGVRKASSRAHVGLTIRGEVSIIDGMFEPLRVGRELKRELHQAGVDLRFAPPPKEE